MSWINDLFLIDNFVYLVVGVAVTASLQRHWRRPGAHRLAIITFAGMTGALGVLLVARSQTGILPFAIGCALYFACWAMRSTALPSWCPSAAVILAVLTALGFPAGAAWVARIPGYRLQPYDLQLKAWLKANSSPDDAILVPTGPPSELQVKTGHPVIFELETLYLMTYRPGLAPVIGAMARDLYGIDYLDERKLARVAVDGHVIPGSLPLAAVWLSRSEREWKQLREKYNFHLVLSHSSVPLKLRPVVPGEKWSLYAID